MDHTTNYQLSQWVKSDQVQMEDFNADNAKIDTALKAQADTLASVQSQLPGKGTCTVETFSYTGSGGYGQSSPTVIQFRKKPTAYIIEGWDGLLIGAGNASQVLVIYQGSSGTAPFNVVNVTWSGSQLRFFNGDENSQLNKPGRAYHVIAFYPAP